MYLQLASQDFAKEEITLFVLVYFRGESSVASVRLASTRFLLLTSFVVVCFGVGSFGIL